MEEITTNVETTCQDIIADLKDAFDIVYGQIMEDIDNLVASIPDDLTEASGTLPTAIIRLQTNLTKLHIKINSEYKMLSLYITRYEMETKRRKLEIKSSIANQPTGKLTLKEKVDEKYNNETDFDERDYITTRYMYTNSCIKEIDEAKELLKTISIQWYSASKRLRHDEQNSRTNNEGENSGS